MSADKEKLRQWASARCSVKEYCRKEMHEKLRMKGADEKDIVEILNWLEHENYISEKRFTAAFVSDKVRFDHWGRMKIQQALRLKGIKDEMIFETFRQIDETQYTETLQEFIHARLRQTKGDTPYIIKQKVARAAISRGYEAEKVFTTIEKVRIEIGEEE